VVDESRESSIQGDAAQQPPSADAHDAARVARQADAADWHVHTEPQPDAAQGESVAWTADPGNHLTGIEAHLPDPHDIEGPLPVCDYTGDGDEPCEEPSVQRRWSSAAVVTAGSLGAVVGGVFVAVAVVWSLGLLPGSKPLRPLTEATTTPIAKSPAITINAGNNMAEVSEAVATKVVPSVVNVTIRAEGFDPFSGQSFARELGNGSGIIIRSDGYILTNNHVIDGADQIIVTVGVEDMPATVVGVDPSSDLAVLKIEGEGFPSVTPGSSQDLRVGQYVMAVGSPFGLEKTVTVGIISALNRSSLVDDGQADITTYTNLIQTDAAINPGNSGGALVDATGKLVGVNTLIQSTTGTSAGIGFAIPVDFAMDIADQLITTGRATHPYIGVSTATVDENVSAQFGLPVQSGALVQFVSPGSPAEVAGVQRGDIIVTIGGREITSVEDVFAAVREHRVGDKVPVEVVRGDIRQTFDVTLGSDADRQ